MLSGWKFLMIFISVVIVTANKIKFNLDKARLTQCLETYFLNDPNCQFKPFSHHFANIIAEKFYDRSLPRHKFHKDVYYAFYGMKNRKSFAHIDKKIMEQLKEIMRKALVDCIERANLPELEYETPMIRNVLDLILVDFSQFLFIMIRTREGRSELRAYAKRAIASLMSALRLFSMNIDTFRHQLRRFWMLRAQRYFDGRDFQFQYIRHIFTTDRDRQNSFIRLNDVHTQDDFDSFVDRSNQSFALRNPKAFKYDMNKILRIHSMDLLQPRDTIYRAYNKYGLSSAEFYFENHLDQFYRIIFFILELGMRGIIDDESDIYDGPIPDNVMFNSTQAIIWDDDIYQSYLEYLNEELDFTSGREEEFVMFFLQCIEEYINATTAIATTTTISPWRTTPRDFQRNSKKGGVREKDHGKHFLPKRPRTNSDNQRYQSFTNGDNNHFYGYVIFNDDIDELVFPKEELSVFVKRLCDARTYTHSLGVL